MSKIRLDLLLVERGLAESRSKAQAIIMAGQVRVNGQMVDRVSAGVAPDVDVAVESGPRFVSRGGDKLLPALEAFQVNPQDLVCADVGASTGGFTDCLLQHGAAKIYAIDVGKGILHWKLRNDPRVVVMEETNARHVATLPEPVQLVTCDASFISLKILLPVIKGWFRPSPPAPLPSASLRARVPEGERGAIVALIKPQFEAGRKDVARGDGVVRDPLIHRRVLEDVLAFAQAEGFCVKGLLRSPLLGPKGNSEFLVWLEPDGEAQPAGELIDRVMQEVAE
jgi:23S rRNA (cytidine1920-2'-O)/16S rRNA (cytidine1409-2'-O)-methyltransferase